jgi:glycerol-3-phosphate dehydrogenase (NAD(P)+)
VTSDKVIEFLISDSRLSVLYSLFSTMNEPQPHIGMIGLGNLGTALANLIAGNGYNVLGWEYQAAVVKAITDERRNPVFLPDVELHPNLAATSDLAGVVQQADVLFLALPSVHLRATLQQCQAQIRSDAIIVNAAKGIDRRTGLTASQTISNLLPHNPLVMLSGPSIANEFARGLPTVVMLAGDRSRDLLAVGRLLDNDHFRVRFSHDRIGVELGGILKNAYVIGLGLFDGRQITSVNFRSVYLTLALEEMTRIAVQLGAQHDTFFYLAGLGDLLATALSEHSHNRRLGQLLAAGMPLAEIEQSMGVLPEGYNTIQTILLLAEKWHVPAPLANGLWDVLHGRSSATHFIDAFIKDFVR